MIRFLEGDCREVMKTLPDQSVQCVVTSPPYFGLRDYGTGTWEGGDPGCDHVVGAIRTGLGLEKLGERYAGGGHKAAEPKPLTARDICPRCSAVRKDSQIGLEASPAAYVAELVAVFREVRRVLRGDGTVWLNLGDSYSRNPLKGGSVPGGKHDYNPSYGDARRLLSEMAGSSDGFVGRADRAPRRNGGVVEKNLLMIPARVAIALQDDGWYLRSDIIWHKPNPMPESVTDRPTSSHEHIFLLTKRPTYFYDAESVREADAGTDHTRNVVEAIDTSDGYLGAHKGIRTAEGRNGTGRNLRNVWTIATAPFSEAHFATFPPELVERCVKAGASERGCCPSCGAPWERIITKGGPDEAHRAASGADRSGGYNGHSIKNHDAAGVQNASDVKRRILEGMRLKTYGWEPTCACQPANPVPCTVLDPFSGAGTTALVADRLGRNAIGIDLNPTYGEMARERLVQDAGLFAEFG